MTTESNMKAGIDIRPEHLEIVKAILKQHLSAEIKVWAYGSRAKWQAKDHSDLDLMLEHPKGEKIDFKTIARLQSDFEESDLPWKVDVSDWAGISEEFRGIIKKEIVSIISEFELAPNFFETTIGEQVILQRGFDITKKQQVPGDIPVVSSGGISSYHNESKVEAPGVVLGRKGTLGSVYYLDTDFWPHDTSLWVKDFKENNPRFVYYFFLSISSTLKKMDVGAANPALNRNHVHPLKVIWPVRWVQDCIAQYLEGLDSKIQVNRQINQTLEQIAQALFKSWFVDFEPTRTKIEARKNGQDPDRAAMAAIAGKSLEQLDSLPPETLKQLKATAALFPDVFEDSELGEIPEGWASGPLKNIASYTSDRINVSELSVDDYISTENMLEGKKGIVGASSIPSVKTVPSFEAGHILISNIRPYFKKIWLARFKGGRSNDVLGLKSNESIGTIFLYNLLYQDSFFSYMMVTSKGAKMPRGDKTAIMDWVCIQPPHRVQKRYAQMLGGIYELLEHRNRESIHLSSIRDSLLPKLLSGELSINIPKKSGSAG